MTTGTGANSEHYRKLERMYASAPVNRYFKPVLTIDEGRAEIVIPVREDFFHAANAVHGAVYFKAMDDTAFFAVNSLVEDVFVLTISFTVYFLRPVSKGDIRAVGEVVSRSERLYVAESRVLDSEGRVIGRGSGTFMKSRIALTPKIGYA